MRPPIPEHVLKRGRAWRPAGAVVLVLSISSGFLLSTAAAADLPSANDVLARYAEVIGGEAVGSVKNMAAEFNFSMPSQGVYASGVQYRQSPSDYYLRIDLGASGVADFETGVSGDLAWQKHPVTGTSALQGDERQASLWTARINPFSAWQDFFETAETAGEEVVDEKKCLKIAFKSRDGARLESFFDKATGLLVREVVTGAAGAVITKDYGDWEESQGIRSPRAVRQRGLQSYTLRFTDVSYDVDEIPEGTFDVPAVLQTGRR